MTKYILHGGSSNKPSSETDTFFREMAAETKAGSVVLLNYFSRKDEEITRLAEADKGRFLANSDNQDLVFEIATRDGFAEQIARADVLFMKGGETAKLVVAMQKYGNLEELFKDKVIAGSSAGTYVLCKYYWENDIDELGEGLGLFYIKAYCHYSQDVLANVEQLRDHKENLPVLCLRDHQWIVIYK